MIGDRMALHRAWGSVAGLLLLAVVYAFAVHLPSPRFVSLMAWLLMSPFLDGGTASLETVRALSWMLLPLMAAAAALMAPFCEHRPIAAGAARILGGLAVTLAALDMVAQFLLGGSTESSAAIQLLVAGTVLAWTLLLHSFAAEVAGRTPRKRRWLRRIAVGAILLVSGWSVAVLAAATASATSLASGRPYCIAATGGPTLYSPITSVLQLRGTHNYTELTGYKDSSRWFFNGILIVEGADRLEYHAWSYRLWRYVRLPAPNRYIVPFEGACQPRPAFLASLLPGA